MSVRRAQLEITSAEFAEWMAYAALEPFGPVREDQRAGVVAAIIANVNRDTKTRPEPFTVDEFLPRYGTVYEEQPAQEELLKDKLTAWAMSMADNPGERKPGKRPKKENRQGGGHTVASREAEGDGQPDSVSGRGRRRSKAASPPTSS